MASLQRQYKLVEQTYAEDVLVGVGGECDTKSLFALTLSGPVVAITLYVTVYEQTLIEVPVLMSETIILDIFALARWAKPSG